MHKKQRYCLQKVKIHVTLRSYSGRHGVFLLKLGEQSTLFCKHILRTYFLQASDQKTPALNEKSRAVRMCLNEFEAHSVCMLFSGAGVPLIGMFQGVAFFTIEYKTRI